MSTKIKLKRGTNAAVLAYTADIGEPILDTDNMQVRIGDGSTPGGILLSKSDSLYQVEKNAEQMRAITPSGFLPPHQNAEDAVGLVNTTTVLYTATTARSTGIPSLLTKANASVVSDDSNKFYLHNAPQKVNVNGYSIVLENQPSKYCNNIIELPAAPSSGTRQDLIILEVWKEMVTPGASDDAFLPYGSVNYDPKNYESTYDSCTLFSTVQTGGNWPLYLAGTYGNPSEDSSYHGKYVKANDANIATFIANPENNVGITDDGKFFQIRWRIATLENINPDRAIPTGTQWVFNDNNGDNFRPQGQKASRPISGSSTGTDGVLGVQLGGYAVNSTILDSGLYLGGKYTNGNTPLTAISGVSLDGFTYNIPICAVHRRNSTAYSLSNPNGAGSIASGISGRPDDKYYDEVNKDDILDLRHRVSPNGFDVKALHEETQQQLLKSDLTTNWENLNSDPGGYAVYSDSDVYGTKILRSEGVTGEDKVLGDSMFGTTGSELVTNGDFTTDYSGWTDGSSGSGSVSVISSQLNITGIDTNNRGIAKQSVSVTIGKLYKVSIDIINAGVDARVNMGSINGAYDYAQFDCKGTYNSLFKATTSTAYIYVSELGNGTMIVDNVSLYEIDAGTEAAFTQIDETNNSVPARLDGLRNYFSDRPGEQVIYGVVEDTSNAAENPNPQGFFDFGTPATGNMWSLSKAQMVIDIGDEGTYDVSHASAPSVILDGSTYKCWYSGYGVGAYRTIYAEGPDGINWSNHEMVIDKDVEGTYDTSYAYQPSVILDGSTYKCWYTGYDGSTYRILYAEGPDGINWSNHEMVIDKDVEGTYDTSHAYTPSVILDGGTYKMWYAGFDGSNNRIIYCEGTDGINWSNHEMVIDKDVEGTYDTSYAYSPSVIKDGSTYKCWYAGLTGSNFRTLYCEGPDGINWSNHEIVIDIGTEGTYDTVRVYSPSVILDGSTYKCWYSGYDGSNYRIIYNEACYGVRLDSRSLNAAGTRQDLETDRPHFSGRTPDIYWSDDVNNSDYAGKGCKADVNWWTDGSLTMTGDMLYGEVLEPTWTKLTINAASSLVAGDTYTVDAVVCTVKCWNTAKTILWVTYAGSTIVDTTGASSAHTGSGDASITVTAIVTGEGNLDMSGNAVSGVTDLAGSYVGEGEDLHAGKSLLMNAYVEYNAGSGFLTRVPYDDHTTTYPDGRESIKACQFYIDGTQVLPNDGIDFQPFGTPIDPTTDDAGEPDTHCKSTGLMGFVKRGAVIDIGAEGTYDTSHAYQPSVILDSGTYKCWYAGYGASAYRILYAEGPDGINWSNHEMVIDKDVEGTYDISHAYTPSVILDGSTYKCWYSGHDGSNYRTLYCEGPDGINWSNHQLSINIGDEGTYDTGRAYYPSVILDGSTYKCWYTGFDGSYLRIIYCDSADGITWTNHQMVIDKDVEGTYDTSHAYQHSVILDGSTYKMWYAGEASGINRVLYATSTDGKNWAKPVLFMDIGTEGNQDSVDLSKVSIIKDDAAYKVWYTGFSGSYLRIFHSVLTMTDPANTGSSTTGVYSTTGNMNFAPGKDDSVLIQYEHRALQFDTSRLGGSDPSHTLTYTLKYLPDTAMVTTLGTGGKPADNTYYEDYRDFTNEIGYTAYSDYMLTGVELEMDPQGGNIEFSSASFDKPWLTLDTHVPYKFSKYYGRSSYSYKSLEGDYISLSSLDMYSFNGLSTLVTDIYYPAFGSLGMLPPVAIAGCVIMLPGIGEKNKELFIIMGLNLYGNITETTNVSSVTMYNLIGRPVTK